MLAKELSIDLDPYKSEIKELVNEAICARLQKEEDPTRTKTFGKALPEESLLAADFELAQKLQEQESSLRSRRLRTTKMKKDIPHTKSPAAKRLKRAHKTGDSSSFNRPLVLSPALANVIREVITKSDSSLESSNDSDPVAELSRPQVVKHLWAYIKMKGLQDPADRRFIICDDLLLALFKKARVSCFTLNKLLVDHLKKKEDLIDDDSNAKNTLDGDE